MSVVPKFTKDEKLNRREFLSSATAAGVAAASLGKSTHATASDDATAKQVVPTESELAMEFDDPADYSAIEIDDYFVSNPGSDFMVDVEIGRASCRERL